MKYVFSIILLIIIIFTVFKYLEPAKYDDWKLYLRYETKIEKTYNLDHKPVIYTNIAGNIVVILKVDKFVYSENTLILPPPWSVELQKVNKNVKFN